MVLGKRIHVSKGLGTRPSALYGTVLGKRKDRYKTKCAIRYLAQGRIGTRPSVLYGTWQKDTCE